MFQLEYGEEARLELVETVEWLRRHRGTDVAVAFTERLEAAMSQVALLPFAVAHQRRRPGHSLERIP